MSLETKLQEVLKNLTLSNEDRQSYTQDANEIRDIIIEKMKKKDKRFREWFGGSSLTGSYLDDLKIEQPDEFDIHIKIKLPFPIHIIDASKYPGYFFLQSFDAMQHSKLLDPYTEGVFCISRVRLQDWFRDMFVAIFKKGTLLTPRLKSNRTYRVTYHKSLRGYAVAHTFTATAENDKKREIWFDFVPAFEFGKNYWILGKKYIAPDMPWFAVPSPMYPPTKRNHFVFMICAPHQEREILKGKNNLKNSLRLLKAIKDHNGMPKLKSYIIKTVYLWEIEKQANDDFWEQPMGVLLIYMMTCLVRYFEKGNIPFYWNSGLNLLDRLRSIEKYYYTQKLSEILQDLKSFDVNKSNKDFGKIFGC